jgi:hypothetical protein
MECEPSFVRRHSFGLLRDAWCTTTPMSVRTTHHGAPGHAARLRTLVMVAALCAVHGAVGAEMPGSDQPVTITREDYRGWPDTYRLSNGRIEAAVVTAVGPRVIELKASGGANLFHVRDAEAGGRGEPQWMFRGGWRLWIAPEQHETTYALDNTPCAAEVVDGTTLRVTAAPQAAAGIQKVIEVTLDAAQPRLHLVSHIRNVTDHRLTYAAWSLSVMRPGGRAFVPLDVGPLEAFDATRMLRLWSYTEIGDPRYRFGDRLVQIDQSAVRPPAPGQSGRRDDESKIGVDSAQGWAAYLVDRALYLKRFPHAAGSYPDGGATIEIYSSAEFLEVEQLSPLTTLQPGEEIVLPEDWWLFPDVTVPTDEHEALATLQTYVGRAPTP